VPYPLGIWGGGETVIPGVKQMESETDHLPPFSARVKNCGTVAALQT
jgi:hypothetical protein